jgi:isochorismate synthase
VSSVAFRVSDEPALAQWTRLVEEIQREIAAGNFEKAVLARRAIYQLRPTPSPSEVLERLRTTAPDCTRFAIQRQGHVFLGATPEWLIRKRGRRIETEAMAGSSSRNESDAEQRLLESAKDLEEHRLVLEEVVRALQSVCVEMTVPGGPRIRRLRDLLHLHTPVVGQLANDHHVVELVGRLHPTPAVGGAPRNAALAWLNSHETESRGWYASPVGWVDGAGDGEFAVALRSALMIDNVAHLYAGAGIVRESNPALEYEETQLKLASMVRALGVV